MDIPVAEVQRGWVTESRHRGRICVTGPAGQIVLELGDMAAPTLPRSALKPFQAIAMLEHGLDLDGPLLALAAASHAGQAIHIDGVRRIMAGCGLTVADFQHTPDLPADDAALAQWLRKNRGKEPLAHNCSGKHAAMLRTCVIAGWPQDSYRDPSHPLQRAIRAVIEDYCGVIGIPVVDGCTAPAFVTTLPGLARGFGRLGAASDGPAHQVAEVFRRHPEYTSSTTYPVVSLVRQLPEVVVKVGAEGVLAAGLPDGTGIALKLSDGAKRGCFEVMAAVLDALGYEVDGQPCEVRIAAELKQALTVLNLG